MHKNITFKVTSAYWFRVFGSVQIIGIKLA